MRLHPRHKFRRAERLRHIVICSQGQPRHLIHLHIIGSEHKHRYPAPSFDPFQIIISTAIRQIHIQYDQSGKLCLKSHPSRLHTFTLHKIHARLLKRQRNPLPQRTIILHNLNPHPWSPLFTYISVNRTFPSLSRYNGIVLSHRILWSILMYHRISGSSIVYLCFSLKKRWFNQRLLRNHADISPTGSSYPRSYRSHPSPSLLTPSSS